MSVERDPSGRRSVQVEVVVPGTPEQVWEAIATGPGVSSWFMPTRVVTDESGAPKEVRCDFGPGMESVSRVTEWDPPRRFSAESQDLGEGAPAVATEWIVETRSGGTCAVRVVHSLFSSSDDWDGQLESFESGWPWFFHILRLYLMHFRGQKCSMFRAMGSSSRRVTEAWDDFTGSLGLGQPVMGESVNTKSGAPPLKGVVERTGEGGHDQGLMLRLAEPGAGIASLFAMPMGEQVLLVADTYLYGPQSKDTADRQKLAWTTWMSEHFPMSAG